MKQTALKRVLSLVMAVSMLLSWTALPAAAETNDGEGAHTHSHVAGETVAATCTTDGSTVYTCSCGDTYTETVSATGHSYVDGKCSVCGEAEPHTHNHVAGETVAATCTTGGSTVYTCECGDTYTETVSAAGHSYVDGKCSVCGEAEPHTHNHVAGETVAATCTTDGSTVYTCECGDTYTETVSATGHSFADGKCSVCGEAEHTHNHVAGETVAATCTTDGSIVYTCECGDTYTEIVTASGHTYADGVCSVCGEAAPVCSCTALCGETPNADCPVCSEGGECAYVEPIVMPKALYFSDQDKTWGKDVKAVYTDADGNTTQEAMVWQERGYFQSGEAPASTVSVVFTDGTNTTKPCTIETIVKNATDMCVIFDGEEEWMEFAKWEEMAPVEKTPITGTITENMTWNDGDIVKDVVLSGNITITVDGTVTVAGTIKMAPDSISKVTFKGTNNGKLIRGNGFTGQMFYAEGVSGNVQTLNFQSITLDGGAVWTGTTDKTLNRGTVNEGIKATGSVLYLVYANATLTNSTLQNHDDSTGEKANAVFLRYYSKITFGNSTVRNNNSISTYYRGGVVTIRQGGTVKTLNADVYGNSGPNGGFVGISSTGSFGGVVEAYDSKFHNNYSDNGAVFLMQCNSKIGYLLLDGCELYNNASKSGVLTEWAYSRPFIITDTSFHDNECAVWSCHTDPSLEISGKFVVAEDSDYAGYLFDTPLALSGPLSDGASIPISSASLTELMRADGYRRIVSDTANYKVTASDLAKFSLPAGYKFDKMDTNGDGINDYVAVVSDVTYADVTVYDNFPGSTASEKQSIPTTVKGFPALNYAHDGFRFVGWMTAADGTQVISAQLFTGETTLYAKWALEIPAVKLSRKDDGANVNTLVATVTNKLDNAAYTYQWYQDGVLIDGATSEEYTITATATYKCDVTATVEGFESVTGSASGKATLKEVPKDYVAQVGAVKYETLKEAVAAANTIGATVTLLKDIELGEQLTITGNVTISGAFTVKRAAAYTGTLFAVNGGGTLTLDGGMTLDGGNNYSFNKTLYDADFANVNTPIPTADSAKWFTPETGAPVATAYMITNSGTVKLGNVTVQNNYSTNSGIISTGANTNVTLEGAKISHCANIQGSGLVVNASGANLNINVNAGTVIEGNHVGGNHGLFKIYSGAKLTMNGGEIKNNTGWNSNGCVVGVYWGTFEMKGGTICTNSSTYGPSNGRNASIYLHSGAVFNMSGGTICHNYGRSRGGVDAPYSNGSQSITGGMIVDNQSLGGWPTHDLIGTKTMVITGGTYSQDVNEWCPSGYEAIYSEETKYWTVVRAYVAQIGDDENKRFYTVQEAIDAAQAGETVKLLKDVTVTAPVQVKADDKITLDLNGKKLQTSASTNDETVLHVISNAGDLTVTDSTGGGAVISNDCKNADGSKTHNGSAVHTTAGSKLTIDGAKITGTNWGYALVAEGANTTVTVKDGSVIEGAGALKLDGGASGTVSGGSLNLTVQTTNTQDSAVSVNGASTLTVTGGTIDATKVSIENITDGKRVAIASQGTSTVTVKDGTISGLTGDIQAGAAVGSVKVSGGTFQGTGMDELTENAIALTGGTYHYDPAAYVAKGYIAEKIGDNLWTVKIDPSEVVAMVGDKSFLSIYDAIYSVSAGSDVTVKVIKDHTVSTENSSYALIYSAGRNVTLDLNGKTVTFDYTQKNNADAVYASIYVSNGSKMTITGNGKLYNKGNNSAARIAWVASASSLTIENGTFVTEQKDTMFYTSNSNKDIPTTLYIKGGTFEQNTPSESDGSYDFFNQQDGYQKQLIELTGGTYNHDFRTAFQNSWEVTVPETHAVKDNGNGTWSVVGAVAKNVETGKGYFTLQEALNEAVNGQTVQLLQDLAYGADDIVPAHGGATGFGKYDSSNPCIIYTGGSRVNGVNSPSTVNAVLDLNGHSITNSADAYLFMLMDNTRLTFTDSKGGGCITNSTEAPVIWAVGTDTTVTLAKGTFATANDEGLLWSTHGADMIITGGTYRTTASDASLLIVRNESDRKNANYFISGKATVTVKGGSFHGFDPEKMTDDSTDPFTKFDSVPDGYCIHISNNVYTVGENDIGDVIPGSAATCTAPGMVAHYECAHCGKTFLSATHKDTADDVTSAPALGHKFTQDGPWKYDTTTVSEGHYELCENGCGVKGTLHTHRWSAWAPSGTRAIGLETRSCLDCGYSQQRTVHVHEYVFKYDGTNHWIECVATDGLPCDHQIVKEAHKLSAWKNGKYENNQLTNYRHKHCTVEGCGYYVNRPIVWSFADNPKTGDYIMISVGVMAVSAAALVILLLIRKKKQK